MSSLRETLAAQKTHTITDKYIYLGRFIKNQQKEADKNINAGKIFHI